MNESTNKLRTSKNVTVAFKLNGKNYSLWSRLMKVAIGSRSRKAYSHITEEPPEPGSKGYADWEETDLVVFSWIVDNIENDIIADFAHHQTTKAIWDNLAVTFESKADPYLIYDLEDKAIKISQGHQDLETYYRRIHGIWVDVDRCQKQPVDCCDKGIKQFREFSNTKRLFKFLAGLNGEYDAIRRDILKEDPLPSVEAAYGWVKREAARRRVMPPASSQPTVDAGAGSADTSSGEIGYGFGAQSNRPPNRNGPQRPSPPGAAHRLGKPDKSKLWYTHCGMQKHTRETCFQRVGYPEWWEEKQKAMAQAKLAVWVQEIEQQQAATGNQEGTTGPRAQTATYLEVSTSGGSVRAGNFAEKEVALSEPWRGGGQGGANGGKGFGLITYIYCKGVPLVHG